MCVCFKINTVVKNTACTDLFSILKAELPDKVGELVDATATSSGRTVNGMLAGLSISLLSLNPSIPA